MWILRAVCATSVPASGRWFSTFDVHSDAPRCSIQIHICGSKYTTKVADPSHFPIFEEVFTLPECDPDAAVEVLLFHHAGKWIDERKLIGGSEIKVKDLLRRPERSLVIFDSNERVVLGENGDICQVHLMSDGESAPEYLAPEGSSRPGNPRHEDGTTHAMIITRGTRGDVQPFVALARGLANSLGWMVTICTEMNCKAFIKEHSDVQKGAIRFVPSGGNTPAYINKVLSRWAIRSKSELMQAFMLARSEMEFFDSAPAMIYWARNLRPNVLIYGFTMPHIALMISELFKIPMIGFILQPNVIPSKELLAIEPLSDFLLCGEAHITTHVAHARLKKIHDYSPTHGRLNHIRATYGLPPLKVNSFQLLQAYNMPLIVPINEFCFGRHPADWSPNTVFTDFIFLRRPRLDGKPDAFLEPVLDAADVGAEFAIFIEEAKGAQAPVVLMAFSSMPVPRQEILEMAIKIIRECPQKPRVIALVGVGQKVPLKTSFTDQVNRLKEEKLLLEAAGAPFDVLFPNVSCAIIHGGLGTTAEALRAGVPTIVTGVLLMDQRFWGKRVAELQVGPEPVFIDDFSSVCVHQVNRVLNESFAQRAKAVAKVAAGETEDGVEENTRMVEKMLRNHPQPWKTPVGSHHSSSVCCVS
eukprot:GGOE01054745.1.p1 GENE.GGOE01054745.1~~GGOE01054745.1.p1  ORF type:complete len:641 (+),score=129.55 GGOE01054745.1:66-1988(+)